MRFLGEKMLRTQMNADFHDSIKPKIFFRGLSPQSRVS